MTNPTNTDLAAALREIADTVPLGSALVVRLAADRLAEMVVSDACADPDGWIEWDASAPDSMDGPRLAGETSVQVVFKNGDPGGQASVN